MLARHIGEYHFLADEKTGITFRWGKTLNDNPTFAPIPELADISISNKCSKGCTFCYKNSTLDGKVMSVEEYCQVLDSMNSPEHGTIFQVAIGGGEPLEHPDFYKIVEETAKRGIVLNFRPFSSKKCCWANAQVSVSLTAHHSGSARISASIFTGRSKV